MRRTHPILAFLTVLAFLGLCGAARAEEEPVIPEWPMEELSPAFVWESILGENKVKVPGRSRPRNCRMAGLYGRVRHGRFGQMDVVDGAFFADFGSGRRVATQIAESGRFALEATVAPRTDDGEMPTGWIAALDAEEEPLAFALVQWGKELVLLLGRGSEEKGPTEVNLGKLPAGTPQHVVVNVGRDRITSFLDGEKAVEADAPAFDPAAWEAATLAFGSDWHLKNKWAGMLEGVAIYPHELSAETVRQHGRYFRQKVSQRPQLLPIVVKGSLRGTSQPPDETVYPRALVLYRYDVEEVISGSLDAEAIMVYHWAILGAEKQPVLERGFGKSYRLKVVPYEEFEAVLKEEQRSEGAFMPGLPSLYDISR